VATKRKALPPKSRRSRRPRDYVTFAADGSLVLLSGKTGSSRKLTAEETENVVELLKQRQKLAAQVKAKLRPLLKAKGISTEDAVIWDGIWDCFP